MKELKTRSEEELKALSDYAKKIKDTNPEEATMIINLLKSHYNFDGKDPQKVEDEIFNVKGHVLPYSERYRNAIQDCISAAEKIKDVTKKEKYISSLKQLEKILQFDEKTISEYKNYIEGNLAAYQAELGLPITFVVAADKKLSNEVKNIKK